MFCGGIRTKVAETRNQSGFSRIDLAAVLVGIFILGGISLSDIQSAEQHVRRRSCANNMRQLAIAMRVYVSDNAEHYPLNDHFKTREDARATNWVSGWLDFDPTNPDNFRIDPNSSLLAPELSGSLLACPSDPGRIVVDGKPTPRVRSYAMNPYIGGKGKQLTKGFRQIEMEEDANPRTVLLLDEDRMTINDGSIDVVIPGAGDPAEQREYVKVGGFPGAYHNGASNFTSADGSVGTVTWHDERIRSAFSNAGERQLIQLGLQTQDGLFFRERFVREGADQVKLYVKCTPNEADVMWSPDLQQNWKAWSPEYTMVGYGSTKVRASKPGYMTKEKSFDTVTDPTTIVITLEKQH